MNPVSAELATIAGIVMVLCTAILSIERLASNRTVETTRLILNRAIALLMCSTTGLAVAVVDAGYPADATAHGLTPYRYWTILALAYCSLMIALAARMRWHLTPRTSTPLVW